MENLRFQYSLFSYHILHILQIRQILLIREVLIVKEWKEPLIDLFTHFYYVSLKSMNQKPDYCLQIIHETGSAVCAILKNLHS